MQSVRIGLLGNSFASKVQLPALKVVGGNEVIGIAGASIDKARATAEKWAIPFATDDYKKVLELEPDLVIITTPVNLHREMVFDALDTKAAVLCEKPFAMNEAEALEMRVRSEGRPCFVDHQLRWNPVRQELRSQLKAKSIGDLWRVEMDFSIPSPGFEKRLYRWWYDSARGGGIFGALGSHMIDLLRFELGEIAAVRAQLDVVVPERPDSEGQLHKCTADEHAVFGLRFKSGVRADCVTSTAVRHARGFTTRYTGSAGTLLIEDEERLLIGDSGAKELVPVSGAPVLPSAESIGMPDMGPFARALPAYLKDVLKAVRSGKSELPGAATFADGLATQRVLGAARQSNATGGGWVELSR